MGSCSNGTGRRIPGDGKSDYLRATTMPGCRACRIACSPYPVVCPRTSKEHLNSGEKLPMARLNFGAFLARIIRRRASDAQFRATRFRRTDRRARLRRISGAARSSWAEIIARRKCSSPPTANATKRIKSAPADLDAICNIPQRRQAMVQSIPQDRRRELFGYGPARWIRCAHTLGLDPMTRADRQVRSVGYHPPHLPRASGSPPRARHHERRRPSASAAAGRHAIGGRRRSRRRA